MDIEILIVCGDRHTQDDGSVLWHNAQYKGGVVLGTTDDTKALKEEAIHMTKSLLKDLK